MSQEAAAGLLIDRVEKSKKNIAKTKFLGQIKEEFLYIEVSLPLQQKVTPRGQFQVHNTETAIATYRLNWPRGQ